MAAAMVEKVTVDKSYFDALLRRADFHTAGQAPSRSDPASVSISRVEYDSLLRSAREYELLKSALFKGGLTSDTLALLTAGDTDDHSPQSPVHGWADDGFYDLSLEYNAQLPLRRGIASRHDPPSNTYIGNPRPSLATAGAGHTFESYQTVTKPRPFGDSRQVSYDVAPSSVPEESGFEEADSVVDVNTEVGPALANSRSAPRTLFFVGFKGRTSYRDFLSVVKGGKLLCVNLRSEKSATVTFLDAAADYLAWVKRNDIYLNGRRIEVKWADRQFKLNGHISNKIANGATRNILIRNAHEKGLTEKQIRDDMEHIHGLVIVDIIFENGHAYVSTNSVHNALFARTCMMSRSTYRGCKIDFYPDECDVALPTRVRVPSINGTKPPKIVPLANRFNMLNMDTIEGGSDEESHHAFDSHVGDSDNGEDDNVNIKSRHRVRLDSLDSDSSQ